ncbi:MAG: adenylosuccinate lyase [Planctomycetes bacterium]|nr:adenylosuccinate lyase [Planctomycetota bacterium]
MTTRDRYESPLASRNASARMQEVWSPQRKFSTWRRLWLALAEAEHELGLPVSREQVDEIRAHLDDIDFAAAAGHEKRLRHDVMAHVHTLGDAAPKARPIIHLGATSLDVTDNTELILLREAMRVIAAKLANVVDALGKFAATHRALPTLGFTHYQPAQPTTVGKRAALWAYEFALALEEIEHRLATLRFRGIKGTTGTQASFLELFGGDHAKVVELDRLVAKKLGFTEAGSYAVTGQTYPRIVDAQIVAALAGVGVAVSKMCNDIRLLANRKELEEPFEEEQIGSSAMAYKRNPVLCERATGLSRFVISIATSPFITGATQWLERTLDDSANRRLALPEPFLATDGALDLCINIVRGLVVYPATIRRNLMAELPFMATENLMMAAVKAGADRQDVHEIIRRHSQAAGQRVKAEGADNDLLDRLKGEKVFSGIDMSAVMDPARFVGRSPEQVDEFLASVVEPVRRRYRDELGYTPQISV